MADESTDNSPVVDSEETGEPVESDTGSGAHAAQSVDEDLRMLESVLERTRAEIRQPPVYEGLLWYGVTLLAVVLSALLVAWLVPEYGYTAARWMMIVGSGSATLGAGVALGYYLWRRPTLEQTASKVQRHHTEFRSDLVAALQFGRSLSEQGGASLRERGTSPEIARAHLSRTVRKLRDETSGGSLADRVPCRDKTPAVLAFSGGIAAMLIPLFIAPGWTLGVLTGERIGAPVVGERVVEEPIVAGVEGVFVYPSYTDRERERRDLGAGRIESLRGTEVHLNTRLLPREWASVEMVVETDDGSEEVIDMTLDAPNRASTSISLEQSGHYWFRGETLEGRPVEDQNQRRIEVREDEPPRLEVVSPQGRVDVEPDQVVEFELEAQDPYGIDAIRKVHHFQGAEDSAERERIEGIGFDEQPTEVETTVQFDLEPLDLQPKDAVVVFFEARDINIVTGPGESESQPVQLYVESPEDRHMENIAAQQQMLESVIDHLAEVLESPVGQRHRDGEGFYEQRVDEQLDDDVRQHHYRRADTLHQRRDGIVESMDDLAEQLEEDALVAGRDLTLFKSVRDRIEQLQSDGNELFDRLEDRADRRDLTIAHVQQLADHTADAEAEFEHSVLTLEELLISQKMDLVEMTADQIDEKRQRLRELLEQYRDTDDPELEEAIEREMHRLRQRLEELTARMQMQMREMPDEHVNLEAMEQMQMDDDADDLGAQMDEVQRLLDDGDIDGAIETLDEMEAQLDSLGGQMEESFAEMQPPGISELDESVDEMMDEVTHLREMEAELEEQTRQLRDDLREERQEQLDEMLDPVTEQLLEDIEAQHRDLDRIDERDLTERDHQEIDDTAGAMDRLEEMVEQQDMEQALERARRARHQAQSMRSTMNLSQRYTDDDSPQGRDLDRSVEDADEIVERAEDIEDQIEEFMQQAQQDLEPEEEERFEELADEQQQIRERTEQLGEEIEQQGEQYPQLQEQLGEPVDEAQQSMQEAEQQLRDRQMQPALDAERAALEHLEQLDDSMGQALQQQRQEDRRDQEGRRPMAEQEEVEIPGEEGGDYRERIREEMMEGMRDGRIEEYESQIERYFRSLVE